MSVASPDRVDNSLRMSDLFSTALLDKHLADGVVQQQKHPTLNLYIYSYTHKAQYEGIWDEVTNECRGLIVDGAGYVVARPFRKFHNLNTPSVPETLEVNLPNSAPEVTQKLDGSLGILWRYSGEFGIATRGSFTSEQAQWATRWLRRHYKEPYNSGLWPDEWTPVFEIIYPENRIVCTYDFEGLVLLALINNRTGREVVRDVLEDYAKINSVQVVDKFRKSLAECVAENNPNEEGYVLTWRRPYQPPLKVKVKFADYVRLHRIVTGLNPKDVWELMSQNRDQEIRDLINDEKMPEHFREWLMCCYEDLDFKYLRLLEEASFIYDTARQALRWDGARKDFALFFQTQAKDKRLLPILFQMLDHPLNSQHPDVQKAIWKQLKPRGALNAFRKDGE